MTLQPSTISTSSVIFERRSLVFYGIVLILAFLLMPLLSPSVQGLGNVTGREMYSVAFGGLAALVFLVPVAGVLALIARFLLREGEKPSLVENVITIAGGIAVGYALIALQTLLTRANGDVGVALNSAGMGIWVTLIIGLALLGTRVAPRMSFAFGWIAFAFVFMQFLRRDMQLFSFWAAVAFPMLMISPFFVLDMPIKGWTKVVICLLVTLILLPLIGIKDTTFLNILIDISIYGVMAVGLNIVIGFAGLLDLGYIAFFAVGAYLWGMVTSTQGDTIFQVNGALVSPNAIWLFLFLGVIAAGVAGILLGLPVLRLRGDYLAIVTLGFGEIIKTLVSNLGNVSSSPLTKINLTGGAQGLPGIPHPDFPQFLYDIVRSVAELIGRRDLTSSQLDGIVLQVAFYGLSLFIGVLAVVVTARLDNSAIGRAWTAIREDDVAAQAMGIPRVRMKLLAFAMGASFAGAMGVIFATKQTFIDPKSIEFTKSILILVIVIVGGMGSIRGVLLGAVVVTLLNQLILPFFSLQVNTLKNAKYIIPIIQLEFEKWPAALSPERYQQFVFGLLLIIMMIFRPEGIFPAKRRKLEMHSEDEPEIVPAATPANTAPGA
ncbi:MAG TPA: hypothetical protein PLD47_06850 [Aggregatilineales bacterium]|nr:hypothetical protein [Anaerolineales bacterium]HRE47427.1 hypothetical protein [Aggregatilineales bacterium]